MTTPSHDQFRAARAWLRWSRPEAAARANLAVKTVAGLEAGCLASKPGSVARLRAAYELAGVEFTFPGMNVALAIAGGVRGPAMPVRTIAL